MKTRKALHISLFLIGVMLLPITSKPVYAGGVGDAAATGGFLGAMEGLGKALMDSGARDAQLRQQKELLEYQHQLEMEQMRKRDEQARARQEDERKRQEAARIEAEKQQREKEASAVSIGSGFFVTSDGYFVTNYHVVKGAASITLLTTNGNKSEGKIVRVDRVNDLALIKVDGKFSALPITSSRAARRGQSVATVGYPHADVQGVEPKVTEGVISSLSGIADDPRIFQISVPVQSGNSGGPLVTREGNVIGIIVSKLSALAMLKQTGDMTQNVNYAIKANYLLELLSSEQLDGKLPQPNKKTRSLEDVTNVVEKATALVVASPPKSAKLDNYKSSSSNDGKGAVQTLPPSQTLRIVEFPDTGILSPYIQGENVTPGSMNTALTEVEARLRSGGFSVIGKYQLQGIYGSGVIIVTDQAILDSIAEIGGDVIVGAAIRVGVKADGTVSYMNPEYWYRAYFRGNYNKYAQVVKGVDSRLKRTLGAITQFGGGIKASDLATYHYMYGMEYFEDNRNLSNFASFDDAVEMIRSNLNKGTGNTAKVYEIVMPNKKIAVFGVAMNDPVTGEGVWVNKIDGSENIAALPYEIFVVGGNAMGFFARYRLPLSWPALKMTSFGKIMSTPANIRATLKAVAAGL